MACKIIVIDGLDGSGKATQSEILKDLLIRDGYRVEKFSFPDYDSESSALVKMYLSGEFGDNPEDVNAYVASVFYSVDRIASYIKCWKDYNDKYDFIIFDRYTTSNIVHQMAKLKDDEKDKYLQWLYDLEYNKFKLPKPDLIFFLDLEPEVSQKLMLGRYSGDENKKDIHEKNVEYLNTCRNSAKYAIDKLDWVKIDCSVNGELRSIDDISQNLYSIVKNMFI